MDEFNFSEIEKKWQKKWEDSKLFEVKEDSKKKKFYVVEMYPYPSGSGLHIGHAFNYTLGDIQARFNLMKGFNVLHPMGFDSFGLPAENAAVKNKSHPKQYTEEAIANFIRQQKALGLTYDWNRMVESHNPDYYKWDQWIFLKMFEKGLAFRKTAPVNWCPKCNGVLANEQVHNGKCWVHKDSNVEIKHLEQWFFKITDYADELYEKIETLKNWPERVKAMQRNWIGKSHGTEINFEIINPDKEKVGNVIIVHGANDSEKSAFEGGRENTRHWFPWIRKELGNRKIVFSNELYPQDWKPDYKEWKIIFEKNKIDENTILVGHSLGCGFILRWLAENKKKVKKIILVAPYVLDSPELPDLKEMVSFDFDSSLNSLSEELIVFSSENDYPFILKSVKEINKTLKVRQVLFKDKGHFTLGDMGKEEFPELLYEIISNKKWPIFTTRPDTIFGVTFMVVSAQHQRLNELVTSEQKKEVEKFLKKVRSTSEKDLKDLEKEGVFTGSYAINPITQEKVPVYAGNFVVADYGAGMVMAVPAHDQRDFEFAKKYKIDIKLVVQPEEKIDVKKMNSAYTGKGELINSQEFDGLDNGEAKEHITKYLEEKNLGKKVVNFKLRDWLISRQRFWGTPIPIIYCDNCGVVPVPEKDLPVKLPENIKFTSEKNPLKDCKEFIEVKCPVCGAKARRETDTMDTFVNSSWYFFRYCDSKNKKEIFDIEKAKYWMPMDLYIGGAEHACMHLIYTRFYTKFLRDLGLTDLDEPTYNLFNQGMVHGSDGVVMSKSRGNVVDPLEVIKNYSADTLRIFLVSIASPDKDSSWSPTGIESMHRFLNKFINFVTEVKKEKSSERIESKLNRAIKEITSDIGQMQYNLAVIKFRQFIDSISDEKEISKKDLEKIIKLVSPFCPHISEELWENIGNKPFVSNGKWPEFDETKINDEIEKQEKAIESLVGDITNILKIVGNKKKVYVYTLPQEKQIYEEALDTIKKRTNLDVFVYSVSDKDKYDPENKSKKSKPSRPAVYLE